MKQIARYLPVLAVFATGYACGSGGGAAAVAAMETLFEFGGASLSSFLEQAGTPVITAPFGIAEQIPEDGTRHFTLTVAAQNHEARSDTAALYAEMDGFGSSGEVWGGNILAFAHSNKTGGAVQGLEVDVGNLGTSQPVPVTGINVFAIGPVRSDVALGILNSTAAGPGGFREGIAFHSSPGGTAVSEALMRVHAGFGRVESGIDLTEAEFIGPAISTPGFRVGPSGEVRSARLASGATAYACVDGDGSLFASQTPCVP